MAGENDFFLRFGSNAESFAQEVETGVSRAYAQIGQLSKAVQQLNLSLRESPARDFLSSMQDEMRGVSRTIARTLSAELRSALTRELSNLQIAPNVTVQGGGGTTAGRTNATSTPEADRVAAEASRATKAVKLSADELNTAVRGVDVALKSVESELRDAGKVFQGLNTQTQQAILQGAQRLRHLEGQLSQGRIMRERAEASGQTAAVAKIDQTASIMRAEVRSLLGQVAALAQGQIDPKSVSPGGVARAPSDVTAQAMDRESLAALMNAAETQQRAATVFERAVGKFDANLERLTASLQNVRVAPDESVASQRAVAQKAPERDFLAAEVSQARGYVQTLFDALEPVRTGAARKADAPRILREGPLSDARQDLQAALGGGADATKAVNQVLGQLQRESVTVDDVMNKLEGRLREAAGATEQVIGSSREVAQTNEVLADVNKREADASRAVTAAKQRAAAATGEAAGGPAFGPPVPTNVLNRQARIATQRQRDLSSIITGRPPGGATDVSNEVVGLQQQIASTWEPLLDQRQVMEGVFDKMDLGRTGGRQPGENPAADQYAARMRQTFLDLDDDMVAAARKELNRLTGRSGPRLEGPDLGGTAVRGVVMSTLQQDPGRQRQDRFTRGLELQEQLTTQGALPRDLAQQLSDIKASFGPEDRQRFEEVQRLSKSERQEYIENKRRLGESNRALVEFTRQLVRTTTTLIPRGPARPDPILSRVPGTGAPVEERRVAELQDILNLAAVKQQAQGEAAALEAITRYPDVSVAEMESVLTQTAGEGAIKKTAIQELERIDEAVANAFVQSVDPNLLRDVRPDQVGRAVTDLYDALPTPQDLQVEGGGTLSAQQIQSSMARVRERQARDVADERLFQQKIEAAGRTEQVRRGGMQSLAGFIERPSDIIGRSGERLDEGGVRLRRRGRTALTVGEEENVVGRFGQNEFSRRLIETYNKGLTEAFELNRQRLIRGEARGALETAETLRRQGIDVDPKEVASAERIMARTEDVPRQLRAVMERLFVTPQAGTEAFTTQQGQSLADLVYGGSASRMRADDTIARDEATVALEARERVRRQLAGRVEGLDISGMKPEQADIAIQRGLDVKGETIDVATALRDASKTAVDAFQEGQEFSRVQKDVARTWETTDQRLTEASRALREGPTPERLGAAVAAEERRAHERDLSVSRALRQAEAEAAAEGGTLGRQERAEIEARRRPSYVEARREFQTFEGMDPDLLRRIGMEGGTPEDLNRFMQQFGGQQKVVDDLARRFGLLSRGSEDISLAGMQPDIVEAEPNLARAEAAQKEALDAQTMAAEEARRLRESGRSTEESRAAEARLKKARADVTRTTEEVEKREKIVARRERIIAERQANLEANRAARGVVRRDLRGAIAGGMDEGATATRTELARIAQTQLSSYEQAAGNLEGVLTRIGTEAGLETREVAGARSIEDLEERIARRTEQTAERAARRTERPEEIVRSSADALVTGAEAAALRAQGVQPTLRIPETDAGKLDLARFLAGEGKDVAGFSSTLGQLEQHGRAMQGTDRRDAFQTRVRNQLALLAGEGFHQFATPEYLQRQGIQHPGTALARTDITSQLVEAAMAGSRATSAALVSDPAYAGAQARAIEGRVSERILSVLSSLEGAIGRLVECCASMKRGGVGGEEGVRPQDRAREYASTEELAARVQGRLGQQVAQRVARGEHAEAAMELMADPNLGFSATDARRVIGQMVTQNVRPGEPTFTSEQDIELGRRLRAGERIRGTSQEAFQQFAAGDIEGTARSLVRAKDDVQLALDRVGDAFRLTNEEIAALRGPMEQYQAQLREEAAARATTDAPELTAEAQLRMEQRGRSLPGAAGGIFDPGAEDRMANARQVMGAMMAEGAPLADVLTAVQRAFADLSVEARRTLEGEARLEEERRQAAAAARMAEEAEERLQRLRNMLPAQMRARLDRGQLTGQEAADYFKQTSMGQMPVSQKNVRGLQTIIDEGAQVRATGALAPEALVSASSKNARMAGDAFVEQYTSTLGNMNLSNAIFGANGSLIGNVIRTSGNFIGRYLGGAIVFGLAYRLKELVNTALEVEQTFIRVSSALDATGKSSDGVKRKLQDIAVSTNVDLAATYEVMAQLVGVFDDVNQAARATEVVAQMELISQGALSAREGYRALTAVVSSFQETLMGGRGLDREGAITYVADLATRLQDITGVNIEDTIEGVGRLGQTANAMGIELEFLAATQAAAIKTTGQTGTTVSEAFGRVLAQLQDAKATDILVRMGVTDAATVRARDFQQIMTDLFTNFENLNTAQQQQLGNVISDPRQFYIVNAALQQGADILDIYQDSMNNAGAAADRADEILNTLRGQLGQLGKQVQVLVENLVDLGVLNVFGILVKGAGLFLSVINELLQALTTLGEMSPFFKMATGVGLAVAGMVLLVRLVDTMMGQLGRHMGIPKSTGAADTWEGLRDRRAKRRGEAQARGGRGPLLVPPPSASESLSQTRRGRISEWRRGGGFIGPRIEQFEPYSMIDTPAGRYRQSQRATQAGRRAAPMPLAGARSPLLRGAGRVGRASMLGIGNIAGALDTRFPQLHRGMRRAVDGIGHSMSRLTRSLRSVGPEALGAALAFGLMIDLVTRKAREMQDYFDSLYSGQRRRGEDAAAATEREAEERARDYVRKTSQAQGPRGVMDNLGEFMTFGTSSWKNAGMALGTLGSAVNPANMFGLGGGAGGGVMFGSVGDALSGQLTEAHQATMDGYFESILHARDNMGDGQGALDEANKLRDELRANAEQLVDAQPTTATKAEMARQIEATLDLMDATSSTLRAGIEGMSHATNFTYQQIEAASKAFSFVQGLNNNMRQQFGGMIQSLLGSQGIPPEALAALNAANAPGMDAMSRLHMQTEAMDLLLEQAHLELKEAEDSGTLEEIDRANGILENLLGQRQQLDEAFLAALTDIPSAQAEYALRTGQFAEAQSLLGDAIRGARQRAATRDPGSAEEQQDLMAALDFARQRVEAGLATTVMSLEMAATVTRDPIEKLQRNLELVTARLRAARGAEEGAFTPEEIAGFAREQESIRQQIADEQERVTASLHSLAVSRTRDPMRQANLNYTEALRTLRRAVALNLGQAEINEAAAAVEDAAKAIQDETDAIAAAAERLDIARTRNPLERANKEYAAAMREYRLAIERGRGRAAINEAAAAAEEAAQAVQDLEEDLRSARASLAISEMPRGDAMARAGAELQEALTQQAYAARVFGKNSTEYISATEAVIDAQREVADVVEDIAQAQASLVIALANAAGNTIRAARLGLAEARRKLKQAIADAGGNMNAPDVIAAREAVVDASAALRDTMVDEAMSTIDFNREMEYITNEEAMNQLERLLQNKNLTDDQRRQILRQMKSIQDEINSQFEGQFNIGDIRIPTPFEVRRALKLDEVQDYVNNLIEDTVGFFDGHELPSDLRDALEGDAFDPEKWKDLMFKNPNLNIPGIDDGSGVSAAVSAHEIQMSTSLSTVADNTAGMRTTLDQMLSEIAAFVATPPQTFIEVNGADLGAVMSMIESAVGNRANLRRSPASGRKY